MKEGKTVININYFSSEMQIYKKLLKMRKKKWGANMGSLQKCYKK